MSSHDRSWVLRAPFELVEPYLAAEAAFEALNALGRLERHWRDAKHAMPTHGEGTPVLDKDETVRLYAKYLVRLRDALKMGQTSLAAVEEEFGAVADGAVETSGERSCSSHEHAMKLGNTALFNVATELYVYLEEGPLFPRNEQGPFSESDFIAPIRALVEDDPSLLNSGISQQEYSTLRTMLKQELFRAWKRKYPPGSMPYETWADRSGKSEPPPAPDDTEVPRLRSAYERDHLWLSWNEQERLTPAKIRDRWNAMTDEERQKVSQRKWQKITSARAPKRERDLVKKALLKAKSELGLPREN